MIPRILLGICLTIAGIVFLCGAGFIFAHAFSQREAARLEIHHIALMCRRGASQYGAAFINGDNSVDVDLGEFSDPRKVYTVMATIYAACPYNQLVSACLGVGCSQPNTALPRAKLHLAAPQFATDSLN